MDDKSRQQGDPGGQNQGARRSPGDRTDQGQATGRQSQGPSGQAAPEPPETERGGGHGAQSTSRTNEDEGTSGKS